ncbi:uncharacterized protein TNCV_2810421 [Trichonephila clavipes]|nr:uncharacterized protein TNCV_2810421 [Trichonephila clavipes]
MKLSLLTSHASVCSTTMVVFESGDTWWREDAEQLCYAPPHWSCTGYYGMGRYCISLSHSSSTHFRSLNSQLYISEVLEPVVLPCLQGFATAIFQQDNARPHVARIVPRLPSIRTPRDLTLGAQPKRTFMPNIPVRREKKVLDPAKSSEPSSTENSPKLNCKDVTPKAERGRGRGKSKPQIIQLEGSVFGEGIATSTRKVGRQREYASRSEFSSGRAPYVKKEKPDFEIKDMEKEMKNLLRDDFIDDGDDSNSSEELAKPIIFPIKESKVKKEKIENGESFQNHDFAKEMGFDIQKIAKFIKKEKTEEEQIPVVKPDLSKVPKNEVNDLITSSNSPFFLLELPECITAEATDYQPHEQSVPETSKEIVSIIYITHFLIIISLKKII